MGDAQKVKAPVGVKDQEVAKLLVQERKRFNKLKEELVQREKELAEANVCTPLLQSCQAFVYFIL